MFRDRRDAGRRLATVVSPRAGPGAVVVGLPRGGVVVAAEVAAALGAPLDVIVVRKLGVPQQPEWAMGALGEDGVRVLDEAVLAAAGVSEQQLARVETRERAELERRAAQYRSVHPRTRLRGRTVVVVDDGIATGATARAACQVVRAQGAAHVVLAVPVAPAGWAERLADTADEYVAAEVPARFFAIGQHYEDFRQTTDDEVLRALRSTTGKEGEREHAAGREGEGAAGREGGDGDGTASEDGVG